MSVAVMGPAGPVGAELWPTYPFPMDPKECAVSVLTQSNIRYHGLIHEIDPAQNQVILKNVTIFGTEDRPWTTAPVPKRDEVFEYVSLGGHIIKAAKIYEHVKNTNPAAMNQQKQQEWQQAQTQQRQQQPPPRPAQKEPAGQEQMNMWQRLQQQQQQQQQRQPGLWGGAPMPAVQSQQDVRFSGEPQPAQAAGAALDPREFLAQFNKEQLQQPQKQPQKQQPQPPRDVPQPPTAPFSYLDAARASAAKGAAQPLPHGLHLPS